MANSFALTVAGVNVTESVPAETISWSETGATSIATMEFIYEGTSVPFGRASPYEVILQNNLTGWRLFGGNATGFNDRIAVASLLERQVRSVSYDAWLDRRFLPRWDAKVGNSWMKSDRLIVQRIINDGASGFGLLTTNATVAETNTSLDHLSFDNGSLRDDILKVGDASMSISDTSPRRCFIDFYKNVCYFKGSQGNPAPYRIGNRDYWRTAHQSFVAGAALREATGATAYADNGGAAINWTFNGGYTRNTAALVPNHPGLASTTLDGSTAYATATSASLHPGDTFRISIWFKRARHATTETLVSAGSGDYEIGFDSSDHIVVYKEGTGNNFVTNATVSDTIAHHLVIVRTPGTTIVYLDGASKAGTVTARTFVGAGGAVNLGRRLSATDRYFSGSIASISYHSAGLVAADVLDLYNAGITIVPDDFSFDQDMNQSAFSAYIAGGNAAGTGWQNVPYSSGYGGNVILDINESTTAALAKAFATAYLFGDGADRKAAEFTVSGFDGWRAGQTVTFDYGVPLGIQLGLEIKQIDAQGNSSGQFDYTISAGAAPFSAAFSVQRKNRKG